jgi:hypothetical protein
MLRQIQLMRLFVVLLSLWGFLGGAQAQFNSFPPGAFVGKQAHDPAAGGGGGGVSVVQSTSNTVITAASSLAITFASPIGSSSVIVVGCAAGNNTAVTVTSVTDDKSDTSTDSGGGVVAEGTVEYYAFVRAFLAPTSGAQVVTVTLGAGQQNIGCVIYEVSGLATKAFDQVSSNAATGSSVSTTTGTLAASAEFALALGWSQSPQTANATTLSPGSPTFDFALAFSGGANFVQSAHEITSATSALTGSTAAGFAGLGIYVVTLK